MTTEQPIEKEIDYLQYRVSIAIDLGHWQEAFVLEEKIEELKAELKKRKA